MHGPSKELGKGLVSEWSLVCKPSSRWEQRWSFGWYPYADASWIRRRKAFLLCYVYLFIRFIVFYLVTLSFSDILSFCNKYNCNHYTYNSYVYRLIIHLKTALKKYHQMSIIDYKIFSFLNAFQLVLKKSGNKLWYYIRIVYLYTQYTGITYLISRFIFVFAESRVFGSSRTLEALSTPVRCSLKYWFVD